MAQIQHYVPQFLLRHFARERRKQHRSVAQVWVRDLKTSREFMASVRDVGAEAGFYQVRAGGPHHNWLEEQLSRIEGLAAPAVARLVTSFNWTSHTVDDRTTLAIFLISLYTRGPRVRRNLIELPGQVLEHFKALDETLSTEVLQDLEGAQVSDPVSAHAGVIMDAATHYQAIVDRAWWLLVPPIGSRFNCSDCPVLMENPYPAGLKGNMGLLVPGVILYLPLGPNLMLMVADSVHKLPDRHVYHLGAQEFRRMQWLAGGHTERFVYGREPQDLEVPDGSWLEGRRLQIGIPPFPRGGPDGTRGTA